MTSYSTMPTNPDQSICQSGFTMNLNLDSVKSNTRRLDKDNSKVVAAAIASDWQQDNVWATERWWITLPCRQWTLINKSVLNLLHQLSTRRYLRQRLQHSAHSYLLISPACRLLSSKPASCRCCCRSMWQTDARPLHRPSFAYYAGSVNKEVVPVLEKSGRL